MTTPQSIAPQSGTGSSADIVVRVKGVIPNRWFAFTASIRDAVLGGLADGAAWCYALIGYAKAQTRLVTAYGAWLDVVAYDFLGRNLSRSGLQDDPFRRMIKATILQERVTRLGMNEVVTALAGTAPWIFEPWNSGDTGAYSDANFLCGQFGYDVGRGGYGAMDMPAQTLMIIARPAVGGVPNVDGYDDPIGGYDVGAIEYTDPSTPTTGISNAMILNAINTTRPTGAIVWTQFGTIPNPQSPPACIFHSTSDSQYLAVI